VPSDEHELVSSRGVEQAYVELGVPDGDPIAARVDGNGWQSTVVRIHRPGNCAGPGVHHGKGPVRCRHHDAIGPDRRQRPDLVLRRLSELGGDVTVAPEPKRSIGQSNDDGIVDDRNGHRHRRES